MAVRNGGAYLEESIRSIANQTFCDWEMVAVDDASTDNTAAVLGSWIRRDPRIRMISNAENKGQTASLNVGLRACRGKWVARQDADDISAPERLAQQMAYLKTHPEVLLLGTQGLLIDESGHKVGLLDMPCDQAGIAWASLFLNPFLHTSVVFDLQLVLGVLGGYDESFRVAQDYDLWTRMLNANPTANLARRLVSYRRTDNSLSRKAHDLAFAEANRVAERQAAYLLGRSLTQEESVLGTLFRRGMPARRIAGFQKMCGRLASDFAARHSVLSSGPRSLEAAWHLRLAGSAGKKTAALSELLAALTADPGFTMRWLKDRLA
jgi:glycosyltransferase involved in cell wall biosynthesis